jgi:hypothetical protein
LQNLIFLLPLYNDWKSVQKLIGNINVQVKTINHNADIFIVDDCSPDKEKLNIDDLANIKSLKIIRLNKNLGSQKAISVGLKYLKNIKKKSIITILDSDGEDDPAQIKNMIKSVKRNPNHVTVSCRDKRKEGLIFKLLYFFHKLITFLFTFKWISFGNYASFNSNLIKSILYDDSSWFALSSAYAKNTIIKRLYADRKKRYYGKSKLSLKALFVHAFRINCVFLYRVIFASFSYLFLIFYLNTFFFNLLILPIITFNFFSLIIFFQTNSKEYLHSKDLIKNVVVVK